MYRRSGGPRLQKGLAVRRSALDSAHDRAKPNNYKGLGSSATLCAFSVFTVHIVSKATHFDLVYCWFIVLFLCFRYASVVQLAWYLLFKDAIGRLFNLLYKEHFTI